MTNLLSKPLRLRGRVGNAHLTFKLNSIGGTQVIYEEGGAARGLNIYVRNGDLYVGGKFQMAGGIDADFIARWDGTQFSNLRDPMNPGFNGVTQDVLTITTFDDGTGGGEALYLGGWFHRVGVPECRFEVVTPGFLLESLLQSFAG